MPRNGLTKSLVVQEAVRLMEEKGTAAFSMRSLAEALNVKTASLYNHVDSMESLLVDVCISALQKQQEMEERAIEGKTGTEAIRALASAYRRFAKENRELYLLILNTAASCGPALGENARCIVDPFLKALAHTSLTDTEKIHWQRVLRGIVHGFVSQEDAGFFAHLPADVEESFQTAIHCYIDGLMQAEKRKQA